MKIMRRRRPSMKTALGISMYYVKEGFNHLP